MESLTTQAKPTNQPVRKSRRSNGRGTIRKYRKNQWRWLYRNADGKTLASGITRTKREAEDALDKISSAKQSDKLPDPNKLTVTDFAEQWLEGLDVRPNTSKMYRQELGYVLKHIGSVQLQKLVPLEVNHALEQVKRYVPRENQGGTQLLCKRTVRMVCTRLRAMLDHGVALKLIQSNPALGLGKIKTSKNPLAMRGKALSPQQAKRFFELGELLYSAGVCRLWAAVVLGVSLGLRRGEVMGLRWQDVDFDNDVIKIEQNLTDVDGMPLLSETKTEDSTREIPMMPIVRTVLLRHHVHQQLERQQAREVWQDSGFVFATELGRLTHPATLRKTLNNILDWSDPKSLLPTQKAIHKGHHRQCNRLMNVPEAYRDSLRSLIESGVALPRLRVHDLRHTAATLLLRANVPIEIVSKILGHAKISITMDVYRQVSLEEKRSKMVDLFADLITDPKKS